MWVRGLWLMVSTSILMRWWVPNRVRVAVLRLFGASIGGGCIVRPRVRIDMPWKLSVGDHSWIGEGVWIINPESVALGSNVCVSQEAMLCSGGHDPNSPSFERDSSPIRIEDGVWIAVRATVLRGVTVGAQSTIGAGTVIASSVGPGHVVIRR
ncbi:putative colanic acid biosynthesis acetyltransferase [Gordonia hankookensis]|uniref:Colanic acid biosynthesis acetyltransferase n=2 Tax=Gordonia hankookensis TaxID=589403 RepID=A0ABR7W877_9ACTN|nr:putative colanic acid biosynthesis acetyltransferase [Gordonia hankookensis]